MKFTTFAIACCLSLAILLFAKRQQQPGAHTQFSAVIDLSQSSTTLRAPQLAAAGLAPERLIVPLVIIDTARECGSSTCALSMDGVARWETEHGAVPPGALVIAKTPARHSLVVTPEAVKFLAEARSSFGMGADSALLDIDPKLENYLGQRGMYLLTNLTSLERTPEAGAIGVVAPDKSSQGERAPVRVLALVEQQPAAQ